MSVDMSADGKDIAFDLLGHIYRMGPNGGAALCITQDSGMALNYHPRFSPDGKTIAFISDRAGQANVWSMDADGSNVRAVYYDPNHRYATPVWSADGQAIFATRLAPTPGQAWHRRAASVWRLPLKGTPESIASSSAAQYYASSAAPGGNILYLYSSVMAGKGASIYETDFRLMQLNLQTRALKNISTDMPEGVADPHVERSVLAQLPYDSSGRSVGAGAEIAPVVAPDGSYLAFARAVRVHGERIQRHAYESATALFLKNLKTGQVRQLLMPITKDLTNAIAHYSDTFLPSYAWAPDSRSLIISLRGKIFRVFVADGHVQELRFVAKVERVISEQVRNRVQLDPDDEVRVRFIQWPTASPDGSRLAFVALGKLWTMQLPDGRPEQLLANRDTAVTENLDVHLTPAWRPDGSELAFATWNERDRGHVWRYNVATQSLTRVSTEPGEYIWPTWTPSGEIVAVRGPGAPDARDAWNAPTGWSAVRLRESSAAIVISRVGTPWQPVQFDGSGTMHFAVQWDPRVADNIELPYPDPVELELGTWNAVSMNVAHGSSAIVATFPAAPRASTAPVISEGGNWIAYQADYQIFVERLPSGPDGKAPLEIDPNPNIQRPGRIRADTKGGAYARWRNSTTLEFAEGSEYVTFDVANGNRRIVPVRLHYARDRNPHSVALRNARVITMDGDRVLPRATVVIRDGRIDCVGSCAIGGIQNVLDLSGKTIIPGLIDVHEHIAFELNGVLTRRRARSLLPLAYGITTVVDPAVSAGTLFPLAEMTDSGAILGPRTFGAAEGVFSSTGGPHGSGAVVYGDLLDIASEADADYQVARRAAMGAVTIKNYRLRNRQQQQWLIEAARSRGLSVTAEGGSLQMDLGMIMDGQTGWEHFIPALPIYGDVIEFMGRARATYSPTLSVAGFPDGAMFYYRPRAQLQLDSKFRTFASSSLLQAVTPRESERREAFSFPVLAEGAAGIVRAGGFVTIGAHGENPGIGSHWEIWAYASAMTPAEALRAATISGARFIGLEGELGSITTGKLADLVVLNSNPLEQIEHTADIAFVIKGGWVYDGSRLRRVGDTRR